MKKVCKNCRQKDIDKGRAWDGRRAYRCNSCGSIWTEGMQGKGQDWNKQRQGYQFKDTGAYKKDHWEEQRKKDFGE